MVQTWGGLAHRVTESKGEAESWLPAFIVCTNPRPADALTMSLPESEDTDDAEEPEDRSGGLGRDRARRWL